MSEQPWLKADWPCPPNIKVITTLRFRKLATLKDFNMSPFIGFDFKLAQANHEWLKSQFNFPNLRWLKQVHGAKVIESSPETVEADGVWTQKANQPLAILTADCLPIMLTDKAGETICALHAGWRGLAADIIESGLKPFSGKQVLAWLGPAIGPDSFEVGEEVLEQFKALDSQLEKAFKPSHRDGHFYADLYAIARHCLQARGVEVFGGGQDTLKEKETFYSHRRNPSCGRMATIIWKTA